MTTLERDIKKLCAEIGRDPLLVQGAGGNISWKDGGVLWIKGSGAWLAHADQENIFVPVDLPKLTCALLEKDFHAQPQLIGEHVLRPSIETALHALMPQTIVAHLHAIDALTYLVDQDSQKMVARLFERSVDIMLQATFVHYYKPGPQLAHAIQETLIESPKTNIIFLKNHGIVIGADSIDEMKALIKSLISICSSKKRSTPILGPKLPSVTKELKGCYVPFPDSEVQSLALDINLYKRLASEWVLYPDHAVFLGPEAMTYSSWGSFLGKVQRSDFPELIFIEKIGVFVKLGFSMAKSEQLRCYYNVISRINPQANLDPLSVIEIEALLSWDAEKLRQKTAK